MLKPERLRPTRFAILMCLGLFPAILTSCVERNSGKLERDLWKDIDQLEFRSSEFGVITAGSPRVIAYDNAELEESRTRLRASIFQIRSELQNGEIEPEQASLESRVTSFSLGLTVGKELVKAATAPPNPDSKQTKTEEKPTLEDLIKKALSTVESGSIKPNRIDMTILRLSALRFLETELENLNLVNLSPPQHGYRRIQLSLSLTAWTRPPAKAALVYLDLYPHEADLVCHELVTLYEKIKKAKLTRKEDWQKGYDAARDASSYKPSMEQLLGPTFNVDLLAKWVKRDGEKLNWEKLDWEILDKDPSEIATGCHNFLRLQNKLPKLLHVESPANPRYKLESVFGSTKYDVQGAWADIRTSLFGKASGQKDTASREAAIEITTLTFAAGETRAGWYFKPGRDPKYPVMRPVESRVRMIVDVPRTMTEIEVHVHKAFLDGNEEMLNSFSSQTETQAALRSSLDRIEKHHDRIGHTQCDNDRQRCFPSATYWMLAKSRIRNLISMGWGERLIVDIETPPSSPPIPSQKFAVLANVVSGNKIATQWVAVHEGKIKEINAPDNPPDGYFPHIDLHNDFLYPGFIDTHNHPQYNFIPSARFNITDKKKCKGFFCNRYEWQESKEYQDSVEKPHAAAEGPFPVEALRYGHARALVGGTTSIQGGHDPGEPPTPLHTMWEGHGFKSDTTKLKDLQDNGTLKQYKAQLDKGDIRRLFLHVAEGTDKKSEEELEILDKEGLLRKEVVLIHAVPFDKTHLEKIGNDESSIVWSPRSNLLLYGKTLDIKTALMSGVKVSLAPDWALSGSSNMLQEIKCASTYAKENGIDDVLTAKQLFKMVTATAAEVAGLQDRRGQIKTGFDADFIVVNKAPDASDGFDNLLKAQEGDIKLTVIGGAPVFGNPELVKEIDTDLQYDLVEINKHTKALRATPPLVSAVTKGYGGLGVAKNHLKGVLGGPVADLIEPLDLSICKIKR